MAKRDGPDFEPLFGSRAIDKGLTPRLRDRRLVSEAAEADAGSGAAAGDDGLDGHDAPGGSIGELLDDMESHRTVGTDRTPSGLDRNPVIPVEVYEAQARADAGRGDITPTDVTGNPQRVGTRWFRVRRRVVTAIGAALVLGMLYFAVTLLQVWSTGRADDQGPADAIVVMGAAQYDGRPSPQLAARLDHVVELWPKGVAPLVVVTGGNIPGDRFTEAEASAVYLTERGIPPESILMENSGSTSQESLTLVSELLGERALDEVVIVTDPYHALRSRLIAEELGLDAEVSSTNTSVVTGFDSFKHHVEEAGGVAVGRVIGFRRLADLVD